MTERSMFWDGTVGDGGPYDQSDMMDTFFARITGSQGNAGVLYGWLDDLEVTSEDDISPITVSAGGAYVYGMFYENDAPVKINIPTPTNYATYRVKLRRSWTAQTVRITTGSGLTQTAGTTWDIPLAEVTILSDGTLTIEDQREYLAFATDWGNVPNIVTTDTIGVGAITADDIVDRVRYEFKGQGQIQPDPDNPCSEGVGTYNYWSFSSGGGAQCWVYFQVPYNYVEGTLEFYLYTSPTVAGAGDVEWNYTIYWGLGSTSGETLLSHSSIITPAQGGRAVLTPHRDGLVWIRENIEAGDIVALHIGRDIHGGLDTYANAMALHGIEMEWMADA